MIKLEELNGVMSKLKEDNTDGMDGFTKKIDINKYIKLRVKKDNKIISNLKAKVSALSNPKDKNVYFVVEIENMVHFNFCNK